MSSDGSKSGNGSSPPGTYPAHKARQADIVLNTRRERVVYALVLGGAIAAVLLLFAF